MISLSDYLKRELYGGSERDIIYYLHSLVGYDKDYYVMSPDINIDKSCHMLYHTNISFPKGIPAIGIINDLIVELKSGLLLDTNTSVKQMVKLVRQEEPDSCY